ncbi:nonribosomal protein synthetase condensation domain [Calothrix sp. NIES-4101]|nr:nonribosomal protein synthetase condensation domain [Calothrix sp. NIES-4101]
MKVENIEDIYELTPVQKGILFHSIQGNESQLYLFQIVYNVYSPINIDAFEKSWQILVDRHTILRTGFYWEEIDNPLQVVYTEVKAPINHYDWRNLQQGEQENQLQAFIDSDRQQGFDFSQPCLMRLSLIRLADDCYQLIWTYHFIIIDGWTDSLVIKEFVQIYEALSHNQEISLASTRPYKDYINWLKQQDISKTEFFWRQALQGRQTPTSLKYIEKINQSPTHEQRYDEEKIKLSLTNTQALQSLAIQYRLTLATIFNGIWAILLSRYSRCNDVLYGCTANGRPVDLHGADSIAGIFLNTLPIYIKIDAEQPLLSWLQLLQTKLVQTRRYEYTPLTEIHGWSEVPRKLTLFESIVVMEDFSVKKFVKERGINLKIKYTKTYYKNNYPLNLVIYPDEELLVAFSYDSRRFEISTIIGILKQIEMFLYQLIANPNVLIKDLLFSTKKQQLITSILEEQLLGIELLKI